MIRSALVRFSRGHGPLADRYVRINPASDRSLGGSGYSLECLQCVLNMAPHPKLVMKGSADYAICVYDVSDPGSAETESAPHIVKTAHFPRIVAPKFIGDSDGITEVLQFIYFVSAYSNDNSIIFQ